MNSPSLEVAQAVRDATDEMVNAGDMGMATDGTLSGACGDVSIVLWRMLGTDATRLVTGQYNSLNHAWIYVPDSDEIIDLTATQFGERPRVFVADSWHFYRPYYVMHERVTKVGRSTWGDSGWRARLKKKAERKLQG